MKIKCKLTVALMPFLLMVIYVATVSGVVVAKAMPSDSHRAGKIQLVLQTSSYVNARGASFAASAQVFAINWGQGQIDIWSTATSTHEHTITDSSKYRNCDYGTKQIALSPDGKYVASFGYDGQVRVWSVAAEKPVKKLPKLVGLPISIAWSADGKHIAAGGMEAVRIWSFRSGKLVRTLPAIGHVAFSRDGKTLGTVRKKAYLFDIASGRKTRSFSDKAGVYGPIALSPDGRYVATGGEDPNWTLQLPKDEWGNEVAATEACYSHELKVKVWDRKTGKLLRMLPGHNNLGGGTEVLQFRPDNTLFVAGEGDAAIWNVRTGKKIWDNPIGSPVALSSDGKLFGGSFGVLNVSSRKSLITMHAPPASVLSLAFSPDCKVLAAGDESSDPAIIRQWNVEEGRLTRALQGPNDPLRDVGFITGARLYSNSLNGNYIWDAATGELLQKYEHQGWQLLTPDGTRLVNQQDWGAKATYRISDASTGKMLTEISPKLNGSLSDSAFSSDGQYLAILVHDYPNTPGLEIWNVASGKTVSKIDNAMDDNVEFVFSPDRKTIAGSPSPLKMRNGIRVADNKIVTWDVQTGKLKQQITLGDEPAQTLAFSPDGRIIAAAIGSAIYFYDAETLKETKKLAHGTTNISALAFSPDGSRFASGRQDGTINLWDMHSDKLLITMLGCPSADGKKITQDWLAYTPDGRYDWSPGAASLIRWRYNGKLYMPDVFKNELQRRYLLK